MERKKNSGTHNERQARRAAGRRGRALLMRARGLTLAEIGERMGGITRQRVYAILRG